MKADNLIWIDLEMTGLDTQSDRIIEIATIVTDSSLHTVAEGPVIAIHQDDAVLGAMDEWNRTTHGGTGLLQRVRDSRVTAKDAEMQTLDFLAQHAVAGASPMCGNSICQDRRFMAREMPAVGARRAGRGSEGVDPSSAGRYPRVDQRVGALSPALFEGCVT